MSTPRPPMFQFPQDNSQAPKRDKLLFIEAMIASGELTYRELKVAVLLTMRYSTTEGAAYPPLQYISDALGIQKENVVTTIKSLEAKGWFRIIPGRPGRGKANAHRYVPLPDKVPSAGPLHELVERAKQRRAESKKVPVHRIKGPGLRVKGPTSGTRNVDTLNGDSPETVPLRGTSRPPQGNGTSHVSHSTDDPDLPPEGICISRMQGIEAWLKPKIAMGGYLSRRDQKAAQGYHHFVASVFQIYPAHESVIGGYAYRLVSDLGDILRSNGIEQEEP